MFPLTTLHCHFLRSADCLAEKSAVTALLYMIDMVDELPKLTADIHFIAQDLFLGITKHQFKKELQDWEPKEMVSLSRKTVGQTQSKKF